MLGRGRDRSVYSLGEMVSNLGPVSSPYRSPSLLQKIYNSGGLNLSPPSKLGLMACGRFAVGMLILICLANRKEIADYAYC
jgi:hypothetical protein